MSLRHSLTILAALMLLILIPLPADAGPYRVFSTPLPPLSFMDGDKHKGIFVDVVRELFNDMGMPLEDGDIVAASWARAYSDTLSRPDALLMTLARTPAREHLFQWVGPVHSITLGLIGKQERNITIHSPADALPYRVGGLRNTAPAQMFIAQGFPQNAIQIIPELKQALRMLEADRLDLFAHTADSVFFLMESMGIDASRYRTVYPISTVDLYIGMSRAIPKHVVTRMQQCLETMRVPGPDGISRLDAIRERYQPR